MKHLFLSLTVLLLFQACSTKHKYKKDDTYYASSSHESQDLQILKRLYSHYHDWKGTRYRLGGLSKRGVDCSGFVYLAFLEQFNLTLPRTTRNQIRAGKKVGLRQMKVGDLIFFKTGRDSRHVGIFMGQNKFMHASSSKGVMISQLSNPYWRKRIWFAKHIPELYE